MTDAPDVRTAKAIIFDVCETSDQVRRVEAALAVIEKAARFTYDDDHHTLFDQYCHEIGIEPNTPESSIAYRAWSAARDYFRVHASRDASDGYHTFNELYDHRITLFIAVCRLIITRVPNAEEMPVWRSKLHSDGTAIEGWYVLGIGTKPGWQITYHLPLARWDETNFVDELGRAPAFDGHTSADVLRRLRDLE